MKTYGETWQKQRENQCKFRINLNWVNLPFVLIKPIRNSTTLCRRELYSNYSCYNMLRPSNLAVIRY